MTKLKAGIIIGFILALLGAGVYVMNRTAQAPVAPIAPIKKVVVNWDDIFANNKTELAPPLITAVYACKDERSFAVRMEIKPFGSKHVEIFLPDGTKTLMTLMPVVSTSSALLYGPILSSENKAKLVFSNDYQSIDGGPLMYSVKAGMVSLERNDQPMYLDCMEKKLSLQ